MMVEKKVKVEVVVVLEIKDCFPEKEDDIRISICFKCPSGQKKVLVANGSQFQKILNNQMFQCQLVSQII